jgi:hypothetical protein
MKHFLPLLILTGLLFGQDTTLALNNGRTITGKIISETDSTYIIESEHVLNKIFKRGIIGLMLNLNENQLTTEKEIQKVILAQPKEVGLDGKPNWFVQGGIVSKHSPNIISVVRESQVGANSATYLASGLPLILSVGYRIDNLSMLIGIDPSGEPGGWISYAKDLTVFNPVISFGFGIMFAEDILGPGLHFMPAPVLSITYEFGS